MDKLQQLLLNIPSFEKQKEAKAFLNMIQQVAKMGMNMPALCDGAIQFLWEEFVRNSQRIHKSLVWNSIKKKIHAEVSIDFYFIVNDDHSCIYFENFLSSDEKDVLCLQCWQDVRHIIATLQVLKIPDTTSGSKGIAHVFRKGEVRLNDPIGCGTSSTHFTKPFEALDVMLECVAKYHEYAVRWRCSGVSQESRVSLGDIMEKNKSIRGQTKSLDSQFVMKLCNSIEKLLFGIEK